jgi:catechol 2,3-dioxygenase-like lactoylglutathione lyase family enzyme
MTDISPTPNQYRVTHVGLVVPDLDAAIRFYGEVLGMAPMMPPGEIFRGDGHFGRFAEDTWGSDWTTARSALIGSETEGILELVSYPDCEGSERFRPRRPGLNHFCVVAADVDGLIEAICVAGGARRTDTWTLFEGQPFKVAFAEDPWGNVIEVSSHTTEETYGGRAIAPRAQ